MTRFVTRTYWVPARFWQAEAELGISAYVEQLASVRRRIDKQVDLGIQLTRYGLICEQLESLLMLQPEVRVIGTERELQESIKQEQVVQSVGSPDWLDILLHETESLPVELESTIVAPSEMESHQRAANQWLGQSKALQGSALESRLRMIEVARQLGAGLIDIHSPFHPAAEGATGHTMSSGHGRLRQDQATMEALDSYAFQDEINTELMVGNKLARSKAFREQVVLSLASSVPVQIGSSAKHDEIVEALNSLVFSGPTSTSATTFKVSYSDGSEALPFPLPGLKRGSPREQHQRAIHYGLMSMRHQELDVMVDQYWFRNKEVSRGRPMAETDLYCFHTSLEQLRDVLSYGSTHIYMLQTGFEAAVMGFYRAVVHVMESYPDGCPLSVVPMYYRGAAGFEAGSPWSTDNPSHSAVSPS